VSNILRKKEVHGMKNENRKSSNVVWYIAGGAALAAVAAGLIVSLPDIKRYIKIRSM